MKVVIAGSRSITDRLAVNEAIRLSGFKITEVVSGQARGVDRLGEAYAKDHLLPLRCFPAQWEEYGPIAGPIRNDKMAAYADAVIVLWDGRSSGALSMARCALARGKPLFFRTFL